MKLNARQVVQDIRGGCDDATLIGKYGLSPGQLEKLFKKLLDLGLVESNELAARLKPRSEQGYIRLEADAPVEHCEAEGARNEAHREQNGKQNGVPSHLVFAIFCLLWFFPLGIVATVHASRVKRKLKIGDTEGALASSKAAKRWCWISIWLPLLLILLTPLIFDILGALTLRGAH